MLAAFSSQRSRGRDYAADDYAIPELPAPVREPDPSWAPDYGHDELGPPDPYLAEPWRHDWGSALALAMGVMTVPHGQMVWMWDRWMFSGRASWKTDTSIAVAALGWIAPHVWPQSGDHATFLGTVRSEWMPKPTLLFVVRGTLVSCDPNPPHREGLYG